MDELYKKEFIQNPRTKNKAICFTEEGLKEAKKAFESLFCD